MHIIITLLSLLSLSTKAAYTIDDLEALYQSNDFLEYLVHCKEVSPSKRNENWTKMSTNMAILLVKDIKNKVSLSNSERLAYQNIIKTSSISSNYDVQQGLRAYFLNKAQHTSNSLVLRRITHDATSVITDPVFVLKLAKVLNDKLPLDQDSLVRFLKPILSANICSFYIDDKRYFSVFESLNLYGLSALKSTKIDPDCKKKLASMNQKALIKSQNLEEQKLFEENLRFLGHFSKSIQAYILTRKLLAKKNISSQKIISMWKQIKKLGDSHEQRNKVLGMIQDSKGIKTDLFTYKDKESSFTIKSIDRYFPELFIQLEKDCLSYFKNETPSIADNCHNIFRSKNYKAKNKHHYDKIINSL